jgi:hypothetical protein
MTQTLEDPFGMPIERLCLTARWYNVLKRNGVHTVGQLAALPEPRLRALAYSAAPTVDELKDKVGRLGLFPWDTPAPAASLADTGSPAVDPRGPGRLSSWAISAAGVLLLPAEERARWVEEWKGELSALNSRTARARFIGSLLLAGARQLAVTLRLTRPEHKQADH